MRVTHALTRAVQTRGDELATINGERQRTWKQVGGRVARLAGALHGLGVARGDRVAVLALNSDSYVEVMYAVAWAGAVAVPLNTRWALPEIRYALLDCGAKLLFADSAFAAEAAQLLGSAGVPGVVFMEDGDMPLPAGFSGINALIGASEPAPDHGGAYEDLAAIFYTGGTTGHPKGVMLSHRNIASAGVVWISVLFFSEDTVFLHAAGLFHLAGAAPMFALTLAGGTHVFLPKFSPREAFAAIQRYRINYCLFVPTMIAMLIDEPSLPEYDLTSVKHCEYGGSPIPDAVLVNAMAKLPTWQFYQGYGLTETTALVTTLPWRYHALEGPRSPMRKSAGRPVYGMDLRIVDELGVDVPRGKVGEIIVRGGTVMLGYWNKPEATAAAVRDGWFHTGDAALIDEHGFVYVVDRLKDMIVTGGENVYSGEVENALHQHPAVRECAVIAMPDERWGEAVFAVVVPREGHAPTAEELIAHCRGLIAGYKCPKRVDISAKPLPVSPAGKIQKAVLRQHYSTLTP